MEPAKLGVCTGMDNSVFINGHCLSLSLEKHGTSRREKNSNASMDSSIGAKLFLVVRVF